MTGFHLRGSKQSLSSLTPYVYVQCVFFVYRPEDLNVLNSIREIQGALRIESWDHSTFPYLSNLEYIGCNMTNVLWPIDSPVLSGAGCHIPDHPVAVLIHSSLELLSLDFLSLKQICGGSVVMFNNPQLCFLGDFNPFFSDSSQITCLGDRYARDPEQCGNSFYSFLYPSFFPVPFMYTILTIC